MIIIIIIINFILFKCHILIAKRYTCFNKYNKMRSVPSLYRAKKLASLAICWPNFYSLGNINPKKPHKICGCLIFASISVQMQRYPLADFWWIYLHLQLLSSDCVIYQNLPLLLYITVIKLISNIISNFYTYICLSYIFNS